MPGLLPRLCADMQRSIPEQHWQPSRAAIVGSMAIRKAKQQARVLKRKTVFRGPIFQLTSERVVEPGGVEVRRDIVRHPGSVVILAVEEDGREPRILLARQYRYAVQARLWELPAGRIDRGEPALAAAKRELKEETGYTAAQWKLALRFWASPGFLDESMALYAARKLRPGTAQPEEDEIISKRFVGLSAAVKMVMRGKIRDGKTIAGILWLERTHARPLPKRWR